MIRYIVQFRRLKSLFVALIAVCLAAGCNRYLGVYTLCSYENGWKANVCVSPTLDPYQDFWYAMNSGSGEPYADPSHSRRFLSESP
jgi:hypothetical protein